MDWLVQYIEQFQYLAIAFVLFIAGLGVPIPEDIPLIYGGYMSGQGKMNVYIHFVVCMVFIIIGDVCLYLIGRRIARSGADGSAEVLTVDEAPSRLKKLLTPERKAQVTSYFERYGSWTVFFGRFIAGVRGAVFLTAGLTGFPLYRFILLDALAAFISVPVWIAIGYEVGKEWEKILEVMKTYQLYGLIGLSIAGLIYWLYKKFLGGMAKD